MGFYNRVSNGWEVAKTSFQVLRAHKELIVFPILSAISILLVLGSFCTLTLYSAGWNVDNLQLNNRALLYLCIFLFYIVNYFIVVFFNMALMHCAKLYFDGEEVTVAKGLSFSLSRIKAILSWAVFAATVGVILKIAQDNLGWIGRMIISFVGIVWSVATFFVIPVIAYENVGPYDALKRSGHIMREKWGEGISANFSLGLVSLLCIIPVAVVGMGVTALVNEGLGIGIMVAGVLAIIAVFSALHSIFISAIYNNINGNINDHFNQQMIEGLFEPKR